MIEEQEIEEFCERVKLLKDNANPTNHHVVGFDKGSKYYRIWSEQGSSKSVYCFVEKETGDIYKAASWKIPAKHARGNIKDPTMSGLTAYGAVYLK